MTRDKGTHMTYRRAQRELIRFAIATFAGLWPLMAFADGAAPPRDAVVQELMVRDLAGVIGREVRMLTVEYIAAGASLPHRHNAQVFVYVLDGAVRMQIEGAAPVTLGPGA